MLLVGQVHLISYFFVQRRSMYWIIQSSERVSGDSEKVVVVVGSGGGRKQLEQLKSSGLPAA